MKGQGKPRPNGLQPARLGKEENPLPSPVEAALGLYLENRDELKLSHEAAIVKTIEQLLELFAHFADGERRFHRYFARS